MADGIILALLAGIVALTALLLYPQTIRWPDEGTGAGSAKRTAPSAHGPGGRAPNAGSVDESR